MKQTGSNFFMLSYQNQQLKISKQSGNGKLTPCPPKKGKDIY